MNHVEDAEIPNGLRRRPRREQVAALRTALHAKSPLILPGVPDALSARLAANAGFEACYLTGAGLANVQYGLPDVGLTGLAEVAEQLRRLTGSIDLPVVADADTGYGGPIAVMRTVHELEGAGAAGIQLEDQSMPKRCGHFGGKDLASADDMVAKILAAIRARTEDTVIIARTDARAVEGLDAAIARAERYRDAGADAIFVEAPESRSELERIGAAFDGVPLVANVVEGGRTPELGAAELHELGFQVALFANMVMRVSARAVKDALAELRRAGSTRGLRDQMLSWSERQSLVSLGTFDSMEDELQAEAARSAPAEVQP